MIRQKIKGTKVRRSLAPEEEPNFYLPHWAKTRGVVVDGVTVSPQQIKSVKSVHHGPTAPSIKVTSPEQRKTSNLSSKPVVAQEAPVASLVSMMREQPNQTVQTLPPPPVRKTLEAVSSMPSTDFHDPPVMPLAGDLLFFEGRPFRYIEPIEELPPATSPQVPQQSYKDKLQSMINSIVTDSANWNDTTRRNVCSV